MKSSCLFQKMSRRYLHDDEIFPLINNGNNFDFEDNDVDLLFDVDPKGNSPAANALSGAPNSTFGNAEPNQGGEADPNHVGNANPDHNQAVNVNAMLIPTVQ